ncbi:MAG TPA: iron-sulfur cluster assembly accessory protein [Cytophagales bacterium]|nr:iron-sulfur cluster assembly accessory protein [Cytophagales bacterium]
MNTFAPILISENALIEIKKIISLKNIPVNYGLRVGVKGAGCAGVSYLIGFDNKKETDEEYLIDGISVFIEKKHFMYVIGLKVDFVNEAEQRGFVFVNEK